MTTKESEWSLEHEWESADDYVLRMAKKALEKYLMPAGITPEEEGLVVSIKIERASEIKKPLRVPTFLDDVGCTCTNIGFYNIGCRIHHGR